MHIFQSTFVISINQYNNINSAAELSIQCLFGRQNCGQFVLVINLSSGVSCGKYDSTDFNKENTQCNETQQ